MTDRPALTLTSVTIMSPAPLASAQFYARLLGVELTAAEPARPGEPAEAGWAQLRTASMTLNFEFERCWTPPVWPAQPGAQIATQHLDIWVTDLPGASDWATQCGARLADAQPQDDVRVFFDPQGHPFCLFT